MPASLFTRRFAPAATATTSAEREAAAPLADSSAARQSAPARRRGGPTKTPAGQLQESAAPDGDVLERRAFTITFLSCRLPHRLAEIMATSDGEPNPPISRPGLLSADRLVSLGLAVALVGTQMTWTAFLGWALLHFLR